ncbi:MAG: nucleotide sugar dehydrogenase, partial [Mesorhizobium sp.]
MDASRSIYDHLLNRISTRAAEVGVIGLGYVGLPLAVAVARAGFPVSGFDIEAHKVESLNNGQSYIEAVTSTVLAGQVASGRFRATADFAELAVCEVIIICVPTPLTKNREPDLSFVRNTAGTIAKHLRPGQLVVLESTTYPGT